MTNEEAIARIREHQVIHRLKEPRAVYITKALDMAIKALETQEGDLISREAVLEQINNINERHGFLAYKDYTFLFDFVDSLPSATPQPKVGKWIMNSDYPDRLICDKCNAQFDVWHWESKQMHYCPNCGSYNGGEEDD